MNRCMVMQNGFQVANGENGCITFLFHGWSVNSHLKYGFMLVGVLCMGILNGALTYARHRFNEYSKRSSSLLVNQIILSVLYGVQIVLAYWIMLLVMTYETGLFIMLIFGLVIGYFIFGYIEARNRSKTMPLLSHSDSKYQNQFNSTPCCQTSA